MIYIAFSFYLLLVLFAGMGVYRLWSAMVKPSYVNWAVLPGTIVSEMAYILGSLITGGEIKRAKLIDSGGAAKGGKDGGGGTTTEATPRFKFFGPMVASLLAIVACGAAIVLAHSLLGKGVIDQFNASLAVAPATGLGQHLPTTWVAFWEQVVQQIHLLRRTCEIWADLHWSDWHVPVFVYLSACLAIRIAPAKREPRAMLAAVVVVAAGIALAGQLSIKLGKLMSDLWPLLTYVWANLLFLLAVTLLIRGVVALGRALAGKTK